MKTFTDHWVYRFDYYDFTDTKDRVEDAEGLYKAAAQIKELVAVEAREHGIPSERVVVGGFSQGGAVSVLTGLTIEKQIAGLFILSSYIPLRKETEEVNCPKLHEKSSLVNLYVPKRS